MVRPPPLPALVLAVSLLAPAAAQERDAAWFEDQVAAIHSTTEVERCEAVLELWRWRLEQGQTGAEACAELATRRPEDVGPILEALVDAGPDWLAGALDGLPAPDQARALERLAAARRRAALR